MPAARDLQLATFRLSQDGRVLTARYSSPPLHFLTPEGIHDLDRLTRAVDRDAGVGAVVITGDADGRFMTHADPTALGRAFRLLNPPLPMRVLEPVVRLLGPVLSVPGVVDALDRRAGDVGRGLAMGARWKRAVLRMNASSTVYLAAINGPAMGGGHEIALACDLRYAADDDRVRLGQIETLVGLIPGGGGSQRLPRMLGSARALEHMLEGAPLTAREGLELGLVQRVVAPERLLAETQETAARLARRSPTAVGALKRCVYVGTSRPLSRGLDMELAGFLAAGARPAFGDVVRVFFEELTERDETPLLADTDAWVQGTRVPQLR